jgi:hypothetical protein
VTGDGTQSCKSCAVSFTLPNLRREAISNPDNWKNNGVDCHYSRTARRYRGATKDKIEHLQERLGHAERVLRTVGLIDALGLPSSSAASQDCGRLEVFLRAASLPDPSVDLGGCYSADVSRDPVTAHDLAALHGSDELVESPLVSLSSVGRQARSFDSVSNQQSISSFPYSGPSIIGAESSSGAAHRALSSNCAVPSSTQPDILVSARIEYTPAATSEPTMSRQDPDQRVDAEEPV